MKNLNEMSARVHQLNIMWWRSIEDSEPINRNKGELIALMHSELSEALEGVKGSLMDDHLPHRAMEVVEMADAVIRVLDYCGGFGYDIEKEFHTRIPIQRKETAIAELHLILSYALECERKNKSGIEQIFADFIYNVELYCMTFQFDLWSAVEEKLAYNQRRKDHKPENRKKEDGKKF